MTLARTGRRIRHYLATRGMGRALRHRDYALFSCFGWFSTIGFWVQRIGVQWLTWEMTRSYAWLGAVAFIEAGAIVLVMPFAGTIADKVDRLSLARWTQAAAMVVAAVMAVVTIADMITLPLLIALIALNGIAGGFWTPARLSLVPNLVPPADMPAAIGVNSMLFNLSQFVGPALAGIVIAAFGVGYAFALNALTYIVFLTVLFLITLRPGGRRPQSKGRGFLKDFAQGLSFIVRHPALGPLMALSGFAGLLMRPYRELFAGYADGMFNEGVEGLSMLASSSGLGAALAALFVANFARAEGMSRILVGSMLACAVLLALFGATSSFSVAVVAAGGLALFLTIIGIGAQILVQNGAPEDLRGRIMSLWGIVQLGGPSLGAWGMGALVGSIGFPATLIGAAVLFTLCWLAFASRWHRFRMLERSSLGEEGESG